MQTRQIDELLIPFVQASDGAESELMLANLITNHAEPVVNKILKYKIRRSASMDERQAESEEISSDVMLQLVQRLQNFRADFAERPIGDFKAYVAVTTYNAYDRYISRKYPNRRRLKNGLRYLLTHNAEFAVWQTSSGIWLGGFARWQNAEFGNLEKTNRLDELRDNPRVFASEAGNNWRNQKYGYELLSAIFAWTNAPVELDLLTSVVADWWNITDEAIEIDAASKSFDGENREPVQIADARTQVSVEIERRAFLQNLWNEILELPTRQRAALLLNLRDESGRGIVDLWLIVGVATAKTMAQALELTTEKFAALWRELPLDDNRIAEHLELTRQQVINLRKSARERLARRMKGF
jgi:RNA polymerase sigma factor (sigma-70 family)